MNCTWCNGRGFVVHMPRPLSVPTSIEEIDPTASVTLEHVTCPVCNGSGREPVRCQN